MNSKRTPEKIVEELRDCQYYLGKKDKVRTEKVLRELKEYYTLSDDNWKHLDQTLRSILLDNKKNTLSDESLRELLPRKRDVDGLDKVYWAKDITRNNAIDDCFRILQGRVPRGLSVEEIGKYITSLISKMQRGEYMDWVREIQETATVLHKELYNQSSRKE